MRLEALHAAEENRKELIAYFLFYKKFLKVSKVKTVFSKLHLPNAVAFFYHWKYPFRNRSRFGRLCEFCFICPS